MKTTYSRICEYCRKPFETTIKTAKYCKNGHRIMAWKIRNNVPVPDYAIKQIQDRIPGATEIALANETRLLNEYIELLEAEQQKLRLLDLRDLERVKSDEIYKIQRTISEIENLRFGRDDSKYTDLSIKMKEISEKDILRDVKLKHLKDLDYLELEIKKIKNMHINDYLSKLPADQKLRQTQKSILNNYMRFKKDLIKPLQKRINEIEITIRTDVQMQYETKRREVFDKYKETQIQQLTDEINKIKARNPADDILTNIESLQKRINDTNHNIYLIRKGFNIEELQKEGKIFSTTEIKDMAMEYYDFQDEFKQIFGNPSKKFICIIHGIPGSGKSSFALRFADYFTQFGKVIYYSLEEGIELAFQEKLKRYVKNDFTISTQRNVEKVIKESKNFDLVIIDSVHYANYSPEDIENITKYRHHSKTSYILILHSTKAGDYKGDSYFAHMCDIELKSEAGVIEVRKNRYKAG